MVAFSAPTIHMAEPGSPSISSTDARARNMASQSSESSYFSRERSEGGHRRCVGLQDLPGTENGETSIQHATHQLKTILGMDIKQKYGFIKAKMVRCKLLHIFLWCHVYGGGNQEFLGRLAESDVKKMVAEEILEEGKDRTIMIIKMHAENEVLVSLIGSATVQTPKTANHTQWQDGDGTERAKEIKTTPTELFALITK